MLTFLEFGAIFTALNIIVDMFRYKIHVAHGIDFLFFVPWLAGSIYGVYQGAILAVVLLGVHAVFNMHIAIYQVSSFPSQIAAVLLGNMLGIGGFWISLAVYFGISTAIVAMLRGFGGRFFIFLLTALVFNYILFFTIPYLA